MQHNLSEKDEEALENIVKYCDSATLHLAKFGSTFEDFKENLIFQEACSFDALQIGEAANKLTNEYKNSHPDIPWYQIIALRNTVAHAYGHIDIETLWETIINDFPPLRDFCAKELNLTT